MTLILLYSDGILSTVEKKTKMCESITDWFHNMSTNDNNNVSTTSGQTEINGLDQGYNDNVFNQTQQVQCNIFVIYLEQLIGFLSLIKLCHGLSRNQY